MASNIQVDSGWYRLIRVDKGWETLSVCQQASQSAKKIVITNCSLPSKVLNRKCLHSKYVFYQRISAIKCYLQSSVFFHQKLSSIKGCLHQKCLPPTVFFHQMSSSTKGRTLLKVIFDYRTSSFNGHHPSNFVFHESSSSIKSCLALSSIKGFFL